MYTDAPMFRRCCFCLPLRYGLLAWGYVKMMLLLWFIAFFGNHFRHHPDPFSDVWLMTIVIVLIIETIFNIILIIAAHNKSVRLLFVYYVYVMVESAAVVILVSLLVSWKLYWLHQTRDELHAVSHVIYIMGLLFLDFYFLLLVRSEVKKLEMENLTCSFVNNEAETRCEINKEVMTA